MLSFLTQEYKKKIKTEYFLRFLTVFFIASTILGVIAAIILIPYGTFVAAQGVISQSRLDSLSNSTQVKDSKVFRIELNTLRDDANRLLSSDAAVLPYELITTLSGIASGGIEISSVGYSENQDGSVALSVSGIASTRSTLQAFVISLQNTPGFNGVTIPVSAFAQDKNIDFNLSMNVTGANQTQ